MKYTFEKLQAYDTNGVAYKYEVKEQPIAGYKSEVKGTDIANTKVGETKVEGTKRGTITMQRIVQARLK